ncbi:MAG: hypothetical protein ACUVQN_05480 [Caldisericia bacterium]
MKIHFHPLKEEDLEKLTTYHRVTFKDHFNSKLGSQYTKAYLKWFSVENEFENFIICASDLETNELIGYICGAKTGFQTKMNRELLIPALLGFIKNPFLIFDRRIFHFFIPKIRTLLGLKEFNRISEYEKKFPQPIFSVVSFGINPEIKGQMNLGLLILESFYKAFIEEAKKRNAGTIRATVRTNNKKIIEYYKLKNWELSPITEYKNSMFFYKPIR